MAILYKDSASIKPDANEASLVYGKWGSGKSRFAATYPQPFFIVTDGQTSAIRGKGFKYMEPETYADILTVLSDAALGKEVFAGGAIKTLVLDGISEVTSLITDEMTQNGKAKMDQQKWGAAVDRIRMLLRTITGLKSKYHILVTAKAMIEKDDLTGEVEGFPDTIGKMRNSIGGFFDMVFYAEAGSEFNPALKAQTPVWKLHTIKKGYYPAIDRSGKLGVTEPNDYAAISRKIGGAA